MIFLRASAWLRRGRIGGPGAGAEKQSDAAVFWGEVTRASESECVKIKVASGLSEKTIMFRCMQLTGNALSQAGIIFCHALLGRAVFAAASCFCREPRK